MPPRQPKIIDETGREVVPGSTVGSYMEGDTVVLKCITLGGDVLFSFNICKVFASNNIETSEVFVRRI